MWLETGIPNFIRRADAALRLVENARTWQRAEVEKGQKRTWHRAEVENGRERTWQCAGVKKSPKMQVATS
jgi:hypothetical protein